MKHWSYVFELCCKIFSIKLWTRSVRNKAAATKRSRQRKKHSKQKTFLQKQRRLLMKKVMKIVLNTIQKICLWVGTENLFHIGCTNYMGSAKNSSAKYVEVPAIGDAEHSKSTFKNGDIHSAWSVYEFLTKLISKTSLTSNMLLSYTRRFLKRPLKTHSNQTLKKSLRTLMVIYIHGNSTSTWKGRD